MTRDNDDGHLLDWLKDELALVNAYLGDTAKTDVKRVRQAMSEVRRAVGDWLLLDGEALRRKLKDVAGHDEVPELVAFMERIDPDRPFLMAGERVLASRFRCLVCGAEHVTRDTAELVPCAHCGGEFFQEAPA
ncbi:MAG: zinc ribbon-containing protein [Pseudomonadota bacterium]